MVSCTLWGGMVEAKSSGASMKGTTTTIRRCNFKFLRNILEYQIIWDTFFGVRHSTTKMHLKHVPTLQEFHRNIYIFIYVYK